VTRGLYVHIPFCIRKCAYCDFYSLPGRLASLEGYLKALQAEAEKYSGAAFQTLFLGGGTPSLLPAQGVQIILGNFRSIFDLSSLVEATFEANPESLTETLLDSALASGLNRISIGVQSLSDTELTRVGRIHTASQALQALKKAFQAGFQNISADVILGLPGQTWTSLQRTLVELVSLELPHISVYCLAVEPHTLLASAIPPDLPDGDAQADLYEKTVKLLAGADLQHYEISNFARPGYECLHNLNYWRGGEYLGLGPAAASHLEGRRFKNRPDLDAYLINPLSQIVEAEELPAPAKAAEEAITRLRLLEEGLDMTALAEKFGVSNIRSLLGKIDRLTAEGYLKHTGSRFCLAPEYALVSNPILSQLLGD
jgi:oxygen-independent coproporphyrinogen III oxidase